MAIKQDWRNSSKYYLNPEQENADVQIRFDLLFEIYGLKLSDMRRMIDHKVWHLKQKMEAHGERF